MIKSRPAIDLVDQEEVNSALTQLTEAKHAASADAEEEKANQLWRDIQVLKIASTFVAAIKNIKQKKYRDAWCELEQCEIACKFLGENSSTAFFQESGARFIETYTGKWQSLFPYCVFASPAMVVGYYSCSICNHKIRPRSRCQHTKGRLYNGEICTHQAHELEILEISIVSKPVQKYSVMHNDETLDFSLLEYLCSHIESPFDEWDAHWTTKKFPRARFGSLSENQNCPCQSGCLFGQCCSNKAEIEIPHVDFALRNDLNEEAKSKRFPY